MAGRGLSALPVECITPCAANRRSLYLAPEFEFLAFFSKMREVRAAPTRHVRLADLIRAVAQLGRAPGSGPGGRGFKSHQPDSTNDREGTIERSPRRQAVRSNPTRPIKLPLVKQSGRRGDRPVGSNPTSPIELLTNSLQSSGHRGDKPCV